MKRGKTDGLLNLETVSKMLGVHKETLRRWDRRGVLKAIRLGKRGDRRYLLSDIQKIINQNRK